jgi:hypothetical protein
MPTFFQLDTEGVRSQLLPDLSAGTICLTRMERENDAIDEKALPET